MDVEMPKGHSFQKGFRGMELHIYEDDLDHLEQVELLVKCRFITYWLVCLVFLVSWFASFVL